MLQGHHPALHTTCYFRCNTAVSESWWSLLSSGSGQGGVNKVLLCSSSQSTDCLKDCKWFKSLQKVLERQAMHITGSKCEPGFVYTADKFLAWLKDAPPQCPPLSRGGSHIIIFSHECTASKTRAVFAFRCFSNHSTWVFQDAFIHAWVQLDIIFTSS